MQPANRLRGLHAHQASDELLVIRLLVEPAIESGRRYLELVLRRNRILDVEPRRYLLRDERAVVDRDAAFLVDVDAQQVSTTLSAVVDVDELQPFGFNDPTDLLLHDARNFAHFAPGTKKAAESAASESLLLESRRILTHHYGRVNRPDRAWIPYV